MGGIEKLGYYYRQQRRNVGHLLFRSNRKKKTRKNFFRKKMTDGENLTLNVINPDNIEMS